MNRPLLERLFGSVLKEYGAVTVERLCLTASSMRYSSDEERFAIYRLVGEAHLCAFDLSPRDAINAISYFVESGSVDSLERLFRIAFDRGNLRLADAVLRTGKVSVSKTDLASWIRDRAVKWFDVFVDDKRQVAFIDEEDQKLLHGEIEKYFEPDLFWGEVLSEVNEDSSYPAHRRELIKAMACGVDAVVDLPDRVTDSVDIFEEYAKENGIDVISVIQRGKSGGRASSDVFLVRDSDGIVKIYKRLLVQGNSPLRHRTPNEGDVFAKLANLSYLVGPYRMVNVSSEHQYMVLPVVYGKPYSPLSNVDQNSVVRDVVLALSSLHYAGIMHGDLRYQNILVDPNDGARLIDLGSARFIDNTMGASIPVLLEDCRFATPECVSGRRGNLASDIFQLGVLIANGILGIHPFALSEDFASEDKESEILRYTLPLYLDNPFVSEIDKLPAYLRAMLKIDPMERPSAVEVSSSLGVEHSNSSIRSQRSSEKEVSEDNRPAVLFPARMGIPHKGHIEYIRRIIRLGYHVRISLQSSYVSTPLDPIPKWLVMKMVALSLIESGCRRSDFSFIFTPLFKTQSEMRMYFALMPDYERIVAVASGNPGVEELFPTLPMIDQKAVFGIEGEEYQIRSWGEFIRRAVCQGDIKTFSEYAASGVTAIRTFEEIWAEYSHPEVPFVSGRVSLFVRMPGKTEPERVRLLAYIGPELSIVSHLNRSGHNALILSTYTRDSLVQIDGKSYKLIYRTSEFDGINLFCSFDLELVL